MTIKAPRAGGRPIGFAGYDGTVVIAYPGLDHHVHALWGKGTSFKHRDLTGTISGGRALDSYFAGLQGYASALGKGADRIVFRGSDDHIHEFARQGDNWGYADLTDRTVAPDIALASNPFGYVTPFDGTPRVVYVAAGDFHIHELFLDSTLTGPVWTDGNLTSQNDAPPANNWEVTVDQPGAPNVATSPHAYVTNFAGGEARVVYQGDDRLVHELFLTKGSGEWGHGNLSTRAGTSRGGPPIGYVSSLQGGEARVVFGYVHAKLGSSTTKIYELSLIKSVGKWGFGGLTDNALEETSDLPESAYYTAFGTPAARVLHNMDGRIQELFLTKGAVRWAQGDLTKKAGDAPLASFGPAAFVSENSARLVYAAFDGHIHEIYLQAGKWSNRPLTQLP